LNIKAQHAIKSEHCEQICFLDLETNQIKTICNKMILNYLCI